MSEFSDTCRFYLQESGSNVYQIAHTANLDRTTVQRMLTGKRLPSYEFVNKFCEHLRINTVEKTKILESYMIEKVGKSTYENRKYISTLIEHLSNTLNGNKQFHPQSNSSSCPTDRLMTDILRSAFSDTKKQQIFTNVPAAHEPLYHILCQLQNEYGKCLPIKHLISMYPNPLSIPRSNVNLEKLYYMVPFLFSSYSSYEPYYYYSRMLDSDRETQLFPYYLISKSKLLLLSHDLKVGIIHDDQSIVKKYTEIFESVAKNSQPFVVHYSDPVAALNYYEDITLKYNLPTHSLESQPCIHAYFSSPNHFNKICPDSIPGKDFLVSCSINNYQRYYEHLEDYLSICTITGLEYFLKTGHLSGGLTIYSEPMSITDRKLMVRHFLKLLETTTTYAITNNSFKLANSLQIELYENHLLHIISSRASFFSFLSFSESSICEAFLDYINALAESDAVIPPKEARTKIESLLATI